MNSSKKILCATLVMTAGMMFTTPSEIFAASIEALEQQRAGINETINEARSNLEQNAQKKSATMSELNTINANIDRVQGEINTLAGQMQASQVKIDTKNAEIAVKQKEFEERKGILEERLVNIYENGDVSFLEVLFQAESFSDFLTRYEYMSFIAQKDQDFLKEIEDMRIALEKQRAELEQEKARYASLKSDQEYKKTLLNGELQAKAAYFAQLEKDAVAFQSFLDEQQSHANDISAQIYEMQKQEEARRAAAAAAAAAANNASSASYNQPTPGTQTVLAADPTSGGLLWPVPGNMSISSRYGPRYHPLSGITEFHLGTDIPAPGGTPIVSVKAGTVMWSNSHWSYGNNVVVYHDNGMSTLYAHMQSINVVPGQAVEAGQVIGYVGTTGSSTGNHLHFEVHINGQRTNPEPYLGV